MCASRPLRTRRSSSSKVWWIRFRRTFSPTRGRMPRIYLTRVSLSAEGLKKLGKRQLQPGMPVEVIVKTGERSVLTYLLHPLLKRLSASMKEE